MFINIKNEIGKLDRKLPKNASKNDCLLRDVCWNHQRLDIIATHARQESSQTLVFVLWRCAILFNQILISLDLKTQQGKICRFNQE